jgi:hypothetical protein
MPLLEVQHIKKVSAAFRLKESVAVATDKYAAFIHATADDVTNKANYTDCAMSHPLANLAALPRTLASRVAQANESDSTHDVSARLPSPHGVLKQQEVAAMAANLLSRCAAEEGDLGCACRPLFRRLFGHCFGGLPAPCGSSLFCFGFPALRVTVSLEILFGKYTEKICRDPPEMQSFGTWESAPLARLRRV